MLGHAQFADFFGYVCVCCCVLVCYCCCPPLFPLSSSLPTYTYIHIRIMTTIRHYFKGITKTATVSCQRRAFTPRDEIRAKSRTPSPTANINSTHTTASPRQTSTTAVTTPASAASITSTSPPQTVSSAEEGKSSEPSSPIEPIYPSATRTTYSAEIGYYSASTSSFSSSAPTIVVGKRKSEQLTLDYFAKRSERA